MTIYGEKQTTYNERTRVHEGEGEGEQERKRTARRNESKIARVNDCKSKIG